MPGRSPDAPRPAAAAALQFTLAALAIGLGQLLPPTLARPQEPPFPSEQELRQLQQLVFACGRENASTPCDQARRRADPLLDHPRLPGSCKDVLWQIGQQAVVAGTNSFTRRDQLDRTGLDLVRLCQLRRPAPEALSPRPGNMPRLTGGPEGQG